MPINPRQFFPLPPKRDDKTVDPTPHHYCPGCKSPIYDKKPYCSVCFYSGKYSKSKWKKNGGLGLNYESHRINDEEWLKKAKKRWG